jgi:hypothetical protein
MAHPIPKNSPAGQQVFEQRMEEFRRAEDKPETWAPVRLGWCLDEEAFRKQLPVQVSGRRGSHHDRAELRDGEEEKAERLVNEELARHRWSEKDLAGKPKTDRQKTRIALRLRRETTMTPAWIPQRLRMGSVNTLKSTLQLANSRDPDRFTEAHPHEAGCEDLKRQPDARGTTDECLFER